jgi:hypothetical protein
MINKVNDSNYKVNDLLQRASRYLRASGDAVEGAILDLQDASKGRPEKDNDIHKSRRKVMYAQHRLRALSQAILDLQNV